jgi:hypothetical protein
VRTIQNTQTLCWQIDELSYVKEVVHIGLLGADRLSSSSGQTSIIQNVSLLNPTYNAIPNNPDKRTLLVAYLVFVFAWISLQLWKWRRHVISETSTDFKGLHGVISQVTWHFDGDITVCCELQLPIFVTTVIIFRTWEIHLTEHANIIIKDSFAN